MLFPAGGIIINQHGKGEGGGVPIMPFLTSTLLIIWSEEIRGHGRWKKGKKVV